MMKLREITEEQARAILKTKEIPNELRLASPRVAVVLTQTWCPLWRAMKTYLSKLRDQQIGEDFTIYLLFYDGLPFFEDFMRFKETTFSNENIPYIRYYRDGGFVSDSNYVDESDFFRLLSS